MGHKLKKLWRTLRVRHSFLDLWSIFCCKISKVIKIKIIYLKEKIMGEIGNAMVLSMVLIPVGIAFGYFLLKLQGEEKEEA